MAFALPEAGSYGVGVCFLPSDAFAREHAERLITETIEAEGQRVLGWRDVPVVPEHCGTVARAAAPCIRQVFVESTEADQDAFERRLYVIRRVIERAELPNLAMATLSSRTVVYKGMLTAPQISQYFPDLKDERLV